MGVAFSGYTPETLGKRILRIPDRLLDAAEIVTEQTVAEAVEFQRHILNAETTRTGALRPGNSAGRNKTGQLIDAVHHETTRSRRSVTGRWGWFDDLGGNPVGKILAQDLGGSPSNIPAARSLITSYMTMKERWRSRMRRMAGSL